MSTRHEPDGCLLVIGIASVSIACGCLWGEPVGWLVFGFMCLVVFIVDLVACNKSNKAQCQDNEDTKEELK